MKKLLLVAGIFSCYGIVSGQMTVKDTDAYVLMQVNDEGKEGSITMPSGDAPAVTTNKIYNVEGSLFWNGSPLIAPGWSLTGNSGTIQGTNFIGTTDGADLDLRANNTTTLRLVFGGNILGGAASNFIATGVMSSVVCGGGDGADPNGVLDDYCVVGGGASNSAGFNDEMVTAQMYATVCGGYRNAAFAGGSVVAGGKNNFAYGVSSVISGGMFNQTKGTYSISAGGLMNVARGVCSFAAGNNAKAHHEGSFVWADFSSGPESDSIRSSDANQFIVRARGGIWLGDNNSVSIPSGHFIETSTGGYLTTGGAWTNSSDRNLKQDFEPVDSETILGKVAGLPVMQWRYTAEDASVRHIGPVAQDFYSAFGMGLDDRHLSTVDVDGVALAAIQGLYGRLLEKDAQIAELRGRLETLEAVLGK